MARLKVKGDFSISKERVDVHFPLSFTNQPTKPEINRYLELPIYDMPYYKEPETLQEVTSLKMNMMTLNEDEEQEEELEVVIKFI